MAPRKQTIVRPKKPRGPSRKSHGISRNPASAGTKLIVKLKIRRELLENLLPQIPQYQYPLSAPPSDRAADETIVTESPENNATSVDNNYGLGRGKRHRTKTQHPDTVFGTEMDKLITKTVARSKVEDEEIEHKISTPVSTRSLRRTKRNGSHSRADTPEPPPPRWAEPISQDIVNILNTLRSTADIHVDLPDLYSSDGTEVVKPYTAAVLTDLYIQCYKNRLWHFCDLIADTWIRALRKANERSHKSDNVRDHLWRKNNELEKMFAQKKKGFREDVFKFNIDVEDPKMDRDVTTFSPERLRDLYAYTKPNCGARLLWADSMALSGMYLEYEIARDPKVWPEALFFDIMRPALRMVGRKLTLRIEEAHEGAWCRYHEHDKHKLPCYRLLAWEQQSSREWKNKLKDAATSGRMDVKDGAYQGELGGQKADTVGAGGSLDEVIDFGDVGAEDESEEEG